MWCCWPVIISFRWRYCPNSQLYAGTIVLQDQFAVDHSYPLHVHWRCGESDTAREASIGTVQVIASISEELTPNAPGQDKNEHRLSLPLIVQE